MRRFVIGDIHGAHRALIQCFDRSGFDRNGDLLICMGDLADGWPGVIEVFDELLTINNLVVILGNHDQWLLNWFNTMEAPDIWLIQGGSSTINAFRGRMREEHKDLLRHARLYYKLDNLLFVHGGFDTGIPVELQEWNVFLWDRSLVKKALTFRNDGHNESLTKYDMVYVGHTPTIKFGETTPILSCGICLTDTGAGWPGGVLTMIDIDSAEIYQSEPVEKLYSGANSRSFL